MVAARRESANLYPSAPVRWTALLLLFACAATRPAPMPLDLCFEQPEGPLPFRYAFNHDGSKLAYLKAREADGLTDLWVYDVAGGEHSTLLRAEGPGTLTEAERAARERRRDKTLGIGRYAWNPRDDSILLTLSGDLFVLRDGALERLTKTRAAERDAAWSPDGRSIAFVRNKDVWVWSEGAERRLTKGGGGAVTCGLAEFIAGEELGRHEGFWWAPDSERIAYVEFDESKVPLFRMHDYLHPVGRVVEQRYPRAGDPNVTWALKVVGVGDGETVSIEVADEYLVRVDWAPDGMLWVQTADRPQRKLVLWRCHPTTGWAEPVLEETDDAWVEFHRDLRFLPDGRFLWSSERSGRRHLYLWENGALRQLTSGDWDVHGVEGVSPEGVVTYSASRDPRYRTVHALNLATGDDHSLTPGDAWYGATASEDGRAFVVTRSHAGEATSAVLVRGDRRDVPFAGPRPVPGVPRPEFLTIPADDGTPLHAMLFRARRASPGPAIVHCYGGPGAHLVADRWQSLWHARMVARGYTILTVDNRGSGGYGKDFCRVVSGRLCDWETRDQAAAARWLAKQPFVDGKRIGIWGWSYGGTLTMMCLLHAPDAFACGVAVAPVTDWRDYDTAYTERYLGLPEENPEGYALSSPITAAHTLDRPLFLAHGFMDDNVHFRGAAAFLHKAQQAGKLVETDVYPRGAHGIGGKTERKLLFRKIEAFFDRHLRP